MGKPEEEGVAMQVLDALRTHSYASLVDELLDEKVEQELVGNSGKSYHVVTEAFMDDASTGNLRVMAHVDDGGLRAFKPISAGFVVSPDGVFVDE